MYNVVRLLGPELHLQLSHIHLRCSPWVVGRRDTRFHCGFGLGVLLGLHGLIAPGGLLQPQPRDEDEQQELMNECRRGWGRGGEEGTRGESSELAASDIRQVRVVNRLARTKERFTRASTKQAATQQRGSGGGSAPTMQKVTTMATPRALMLVGPKPLNIGAVASVA